MKKPFAKLVWPLTALMLFSCAGTPAASSSETSHPSSASSQSTSSTSQPSDSSATSSHDLIDTYNVYFFDQDGKLYLHVEVNEGDLVRRPTDPELDQKKFDGWYTADGEKFDFSTPITSNLELFARFSELSYFEGYNPRYQPTVSALSCDDIVIANQKDVTLHLSAKNVTFEEGINTKMIRLSGGFQDMTVKEVTVEDNKLRIRTDGTVGSGQGVVCLAKEVTDIGVFLTACLPIIETDSIIDRTSFGFAEDRTYVDVSIHLPKMTLRNDESLSKEDFIAKVNGGQYKYFGIDNTPGFGLQLLEVADDFGSFRIRILLPGALDRSLCELLTNAAWLHIFPEAVTGNIAIEVPIDLLHPSTKTSVKMYRKNADEYHGYFELKLRSGKLNDDFRNKLDKFIADPLNKNFIVTFADVDTTLTALSSNDGVTLTGEFAVPSSIGDKATASISLAATKNPDDGADLPLAFDFIDGSPLACESETVDVVLDQTLEPGGGTGTVTQSKAQTYYDVRSTVEQNAFHSGPESDYNAGAIVKAATNIGKIGFGLYSGDFTMAKSAAGDLFGIAGLANPSDQILASLAKIAEKLQEIEAKIDNIASQLQSIQAELEKIGQQALLTNYMAANSRWNDFITDYYVPVKDAIVAYSNDYFRYFYNLAIDSYDPFPGKEPTITLYYDRMGNIAFPGRNPSLSIDGKPIDKAATKTVTLPVLNYSLGGIFANDGHVYSSIEEDLIADLIAYDLYDDELIADIVSTIRFNAMQSHFDTTASLDQFNITFANFCTAFTATELGTTQSSITPLDSYRLMLETIYNFGFEIEPEFNLICVRLESTYFCAKSILEFTKFANSGEIISSRYDDLDKAVQKEMTDTRFFHSNVDSSTVYCYASACYVKHSCDAYGIAVDTLWEYGHGCQKLDVYLNRANTYDVNNWNGINGLSSIDEASARLMALKVRLYNSLKGTNLDFRSYLSQIGIIPKDKAEETFGIILSVYGLESDDDTVHDLRFPSGWYVDTDRWYAYALKGKCYSFADNDIVDGGLIGLTWDPGAGNLGEYTGPVNITNVGYVKGFYNNFGVYAYFVNFAPVSV